MNDEGAEPRPGGDLAVAVVGAPGDGSLAAAAETVGPLVDPAAADLVVAVGDRALSSAATLSADTAVLAVDVGGPLAVPRAVAGETLTALDPASLDTVAHPVVTVECGDRRAEAVFDATLATVEPARISEFSVHADGREVDRFRADGVVVATPLGSHGYASAAGGPVVAADADAFVAVPIAPFAIDAERWVLPDDELVVRVEREDAAVDCAADDRRLGTVPPGTPVRVRPGGVVRFVRPPGR
jgi:NAD+ kinase